MYKKIGVENFRVFKDYTEFEIRPITLLTGPNNSGKSSFTKLLMLLQNGIQNLNFETGSHNLESFEKIINWDSESENLILEFGNTIPIFKDTFKTQLQIKKGELSKIIFKSPIDDLLTVQFEEDRSLIEHGTIGFLQTVNLNIKYLIDLIYQKDIFVEVKGDPNQGNKYSCLDRLKPSEEHSESTITNLEEKLRSGVKNFDQNKAFLFRNQALIAEIESLEKDYLLYDILIFGKPLNKNQKEDILEIQNEVFSNLVLSNNFGMKIGSKDIKGNFDIIIENINLVARTKFLEKIKSYFGVEDISIQASRLGNLIFNTLIFKNSFEHYISQPFTINERTIDNFKSIRFLESLFDQFKNLKVELIDYLDRTYYISPSRGNQRRVLMNSSENEIDELVLQFSKLHKTNQKLDFLQKALEVLGIEGELKIERFENFISVISLNRNNRKITLADLGYGYSQIIPILLKIILVNQGFNPTANLIIEEPEANLHPDLQSKLADIIALSLKEFPGLCFIVETHSEYLIRKLQYLTAKKELSPDQSIIYYFNADKYVSREEPKVKKIEITPTGNLTDTFGPGFFDEATQLKFDLMKINKEQNN